MIVTDEQVEAALAYLGDAQVAATVLFNATTAENHCERVYSRMYLTYSGTVAEREALATCSIEYENAQAKEAAAKCALEEHRAQVRSSQMILEIWRTENANARAMERIR